MTFSNGIRFTSGTLLSLFLLVSPAFAQGTIRGKNIKLSDGTDSPSCTTLQFASESMTICGDPSTGKITITNATLSLEGLTVADGPDGTNQIGPFTCNPTLPPECPTDGHMTLWCEGDAGDEHIFVMKSDCVPLDITALGVDLAANYAWTGFHDFSGGTVSNMTSNAAIGSWFRHSARDDQGGPSKPIPFQDDSTALAAHVDPNTFYRWTTNTGNHFAFMQNGDIVIDGLIDGSQIGGAVGYTVVPVAVQELGGGGHSGAEPGAPEGSCSAGLFRTACDGVLAWQTPVALGGGDVRKYTGNPWADDQIQTGKGSGVDSQQSLARMNAAGTLFTMIADATHGTAFCFQEKPSVGTDIKCLETTTVNLPTGTNFVAFWNAGGLTINDALFSSTWVSLTGTQTLTNKTFTNPSLGTGYLSTTKTADAAGVTANLIVKINSTGNVVNAVTSDIGILGVAATTATSGNPVEVATRGIVNCVADNTTIVGNVLIVGTSTAGRCRDSGSTDATTIPSSTQIVGKALTAVSAASNVSVQLYGPGHYGTQTVAHAHTSGTTGGVLADAALGWTTVTLGSDVANTSNPAAYADVTGMSWAVSASTNYEWNCTWLYTSSVTTTGGAFSATAPASPTVFAYTTMMAVASGNGTVNGGNGNDAASASASAASGTSMGQMRGILMNGSNAGTLQLRLINEILLTTFTAKSGSFCKYRTF